MTDPAAPATDRPLRVAYFIAYPQRMAGAARSMLQLVEGLSGRVEPVVITTGEGRVADAYREAGIPVVVIEGSGAVSAFGKQFLGASPWSKLRAAVADVLPFALRLRRAVRANGIDLVHANEPRAALLAALACRLARVPLVAHLRGEFVGGSTLRFLFERAGRRIVSVSEGARRTLSRAGQRKAVVIYNGVEEPASHPAPADLLAPFRASGRVVVCCFASVVPFKGYHHLLRAIALLNERGWRDRATFVAVGEVPAEYGWYRTALDVLQRELGIENFIYAGWQDDPFAFYAGADVCVLPSVSAERLELGGHSLEVAGNEGLPRTHLEAMAFGIPVVGTRIAGVPEQIEDGHTGYIVDPADPAALADRLERLLRDPEQRRRMGAAGRERARRTFSVAACAAATLDVYRSVLPA